MEQILLLIHHAFFFWPPGTLASIGLPKLRLVCAPLQLRGMAARTLLQRENSLGKWDGGDVGTLLTSALWGFQGDLYITPHIYLPTKQVSLAIQTHIDIQCLLLTDYSILGSQCTYSLFRRFYVGPLS